LIILKVSVLIPDSVIDSSPIEDTQNEHEEEEIFSVDDTPIPGPIEEDEEQEEIEEEEVKTDDEEKKDEPVHHEDHNSDERKFLKILNSQIALLFVILMNIS
jgi:hypothetical protein